ncbi:MAG: sigma-70 family RNA polymerase sigma factor [Armatimonadetes bacterium]|jgi:DNA-directed RNA polymerase specialized sigma24 family protein|nr:sigma-70 family RNA polymerase sigma factor [Armatimonadota bacterium]
MGIPTNYPGLTPEMVKLIKGRAYMLSRSYGHTPEDREDLEQDMALHLLSALSRHDPARSSLATFANRVIDLWTKMLVRERRAACRDFRAVDCSLDEPRSDEEGERTTLGDIIGEGDVVTLSERSLGYIEAVELKVVVETIVATLPSVLQELCLALMSQTAGEVSASTGIPRTTIASRVKLIRKVFESAGLGGSRSFRRNSKSSHM